MIPAVPAGALQTEGPVGLRYEDIAQDGRLNLSALPQGLGQIVWPKLMSQPRAPQLREEGVVPILSRLLLQSVSGPLSALRALRGVGHIHHGSVLDAQGQPERLLALMWLELHGLEGWTHDSGAPGAPLIAGRVYAEHVYTRLFAPAQERRVRSLPGLSADPWPWPSFEATGADIQGWTWNQNIAFGLAHTDANAHVNSLVYPRLLEELTLQALASRGLISASFHADCGEFFWRKPFFAGEIATFQLQIQGEGGPGTRVAASVVDATGQIRSRMWIGSLNPSV